MRAFAIVLLLSSAALAADGRVLAGDEAAPRVAVLFEPLSGGTPRAPTVTDLDQVWLSFVPKVQVVAPGSTLVLRDRDDESHSVHAWYDNRTLFNRATVPHGKEQRIVLDKPGVVTITCDLHSEMRAYVIVSPTAYAAVTGVDGRFSVDAPPGRYHVRVWRPEGEVDLGIRTLDQLDLVIPRIDHVVEVHPPPRPAHAAPPPPLPHWLRARGSWPKGDAVWVLSIIGAPLGFGLVWLLFAVGAKRGWSFAWLMLEGCGMAFAFGTLTALGLSPAVATALGFGAFLGTIIVGAQRV